MTEEEFEKETVKFYTKTLYNTMDKIKELKEENKRLTELLNRSNARLAEEQVKNAELEKEKCELLGLIQEKDKLIRKMKCCENCKHHSFWGSELKCNLLDYNTEIECLKSRSQWELAE